MRVQILRILIRNRNSFLLNGKKKGKKKVKEFELYRFLRLFVLDLFL